MRRFTVVFAAAATVAIMACAKTEQKATDSVAAAPPPPPPSLTFADFAGTWSMKTTNQAGDSVLVTYDMVATADSTGWTINFPNRQPVPAHVVSIGGDSVMVDAGPYSSVLRKGVQVTVNTTLHLQDGMLKGTALAHYAGVKSADSVRSLLSEGTKKP